MRWLGITLAAAWLSGCAPQTDSGPDAGGDSHDDFGDGTDASPRPERPDGGGVASELPDAAPDAATPVEWPPCVGGNNRVQDPTNGHCYILLLNTVEWADAANSCSGAGMHLATVRSAAENALIDSLYGNLIVWVGGHDLIVEGQWRWLSGEPFDFGNWAGGEPNNDDGDEHCLTMNGGSASRWNDEECDNDRAYVCERD